MNKFNFEDQFDWNKEIFLDKIDFLNWYRYFAILKKLIEIKPKIVLEIGAGEGTIKNVFEKFTKKYQTMDINEKLKPDYLGKIQETNKDLFNKFDCIIAADILEHIPFEDLEKSLKNIFDYLKTGAYTLITIPHRASYFLLMTPTYKPLEFLLVSVVRALFTAASSKGKFGLILIMNGKLATENTL